MLDTLPLYYHYNLIYQIYDSINLVELFLYLLKSQKQFFHLYSIFLNYDSILKEEYYHYQLYTLQLYIYYYLISQNYVPIIFQFSYYFQQESQQQFNLKCFRQMDYDIQQDIYYLEIVTLVLYFHFYLYLEIKNNNSIFMELRYHQILIYLLQFNYSYS